ncbi:YchJ family protein [Desulfatibacillum aliphaticivorans]|uniref:SEC-C motif domain protein n=1 Tax=Desulfatibacillum aliphaticivorans TaxID=218208 RepID=B8FAT6_DESAL|nr:YchJ family protein [Desulfatibacillum aliphaticivorans]ACL03382.1 SEC-C motif domain protein [Desulfatibacillum aliphaticivorans]
MSQCPCGSEKEYAQCCEPFIKGGDYAKTAEQLMRSRYTAYTLAEIDYIRDTIDPDNNDDFDENSARDWAENSEWHSLEIVSTFKGGEDDEAGQVEFIADYSQKNARTKHHELADFRKIDGKWYFVDGEAVAPKPVKRDKPKVGRNDPCPCGSGKKYKKCCG